MKKTILSLFVTLASMNVIAQTADASVDYQADKKPVRTRPAECPKLYFNAGTGVNYNTAIMGFSLDMPVSKNVSVEAGPGTGEWGNKVYAGIKYYSKPCHRGWAFGAGLSYFRGVHNDKHDLETVYGTASVLYNKLPQTSVSFNGYRYWNIGKKHNRFFVESGWNMVLSHNDKIQQLRGYRITEHQMNSLKSALQDGPILALGFSFSLI